MFSMAKPDADGCSPGPAANVEPGPVLPSYGEDLCSVYLLNTQGLSPHATGNSKWKLPYIAGNVLHEGGLFKPFMAISESWLKSRINDAQIIVPNYTPYRADRQKRKGGGALLLVHNSILVADVQYFDNTVCEAVICTIPSMGAVVSSIYRPPDTTCEEFTPLLQFLDSYLADSLSDKISDTLFLGDLNFPGIDWSQLTYTRTTKDRNASCEKMIDFVSDHLMTQCINKPTRGDNILDVLLTNNDRTIGCTKSTETCLSDHNLVEIILRYNPGKGFKPRTGPVWDPTTYRGRNLETASFDDIRSELDNVDWDQKMSECEEASDGDLDGAHFVDIVRQKVLHVCISHSEPKKNGGSFKGSKDKRLLQRQRNKLKARYLALKARNPGSDKVEQLENELFVMTVKLKDIILSDLARQEEKALNSIKKDSKYFYNYAKRFSKVRCNIGPLTKSDGSLTNDPKEMADILLNQYCGVFTDPLNPRKVVPPLVDNPPHGSLRDIQFTVADVEKAIDDIKPYSGTSVNDIPALVLKQCKKQLSYPIFCIWKKSMLTGKVPPALKVQYIAPIFKKGDKTKAANYRPVSLTSHIIKIFERIVRKQVVSFLEDNNLLSGSQHGFRKGRSCLTQLLHHFDNLLQHILEGNVTDVLYLDFSKAFDKVDHQILLRKLHNIGIQGKLYDWIADFLTERSQTVQVDGKSSIFELVISGVPQGTVLGPLLFILHVDDMSKVVMIVLIGCFADDTRLSIALRAGLIEVDMLALQTDLQNVVQWAIDNNMELNESKFDLLCYSYRPAAELLKSLPFTQSLFQYETPEGYTISGSDRVRDLGVTMSPDCTWSEHISTIAEDGRKMLDWILSVFKDRSQLTMLTLYKSLVRSKLEYCCPLWDPSSLSDIRRLEQIQRLFTSKVHGCKTMSYWDRLKHLKLQSLQRRRERYIIIHTWKILNNLTNNDVGITFQDTGNLTRRGIVANIPPLPRSIPARAVTLYENSFAVRAPKLWNCLPKSVKAVKTLDAFKSSLGSFTDTIPDLPPINGCIGVNNNSILDWACQNFRL